MSKDYEILTLTAENMVPIAMLRITVAESDKVWPDSFYALARVPEADMLIGFGLGFGCVTRISEFPGNLLFPVATNLLFKPQQRKRNA